MDNILEKATRKQIRFAHSGSKSVEDLWQLDLEDLDAIYGKLSDQIDKTSSQSLLTTRSKENTLLNLKIEIVKYIFETKVKEAEEKETKMIKKEKKQNLMKLLEEKENEEFKNMSKEDLLKKIEELD